MRRFAVCGTGHRPDKLGSHWDPRGYRPAIRVVQRVLGDVVREFGPLEVISGMALGFDMILAVAAVQARDDRMPISVTLAIPFEGHYQRWTDPTSLGWYRQLREDADRAVIVSRGGYSAAKLQVRNAWMVDHAQLVLACWNGSRGGTANCIRYAAQRGVPMRNIFAQVIRAC